MAGPTKTESSLINSNVIFVSQEMPMNEAVQTMIDHKISSILVVDHDEQVVGILTERDIVQKFTLLDVEDKLTRTVGTMMTRPVMFANVATLKTDVTKMHLTHKIRHFPVLNGKDTHKNNVVGIVSITDLARQSMMYEQQDSVAADAKAKKTIVGILAQQKHATSLYMNIFSGMGFDAVEVSDLHKFASRADAGSQTLIFDMDGYSDRQLHDMIPVAVKSKCYLILTTSQPSMVPIFKKYINHDHQEIAMKPIDMSYLSWLIASKWHVNETK